jgi:hypothetical protein
MRVTKKDMARVIVQAAHNLPTLAPADDRQVWELVGRNNRENIIMLHNLALRVLGELP